MEGKTQRSYIIKNIIIFLLLTTCIIIINVLSNYLLQLVHHEATTPKFGYIILHPIKLLELVASFTGNILITVVLMYVLFFILHIKISVNKIIYNVLIANFVFITQNVFDLTWVLVHKNELSITQILSFQSFSLYNIINPIPKYFYYATITANLWELVYIIALSLLLKKHLSRSLINSIGLIFLAYGVPLILFMIFVTFIQINNA